MQHEVRLERDIQEKPIESATQQNWREFECAGTGQATCSCGFDTGTVPIADVTRLAREHLDALRTPHTPE
ncbi:MAG TPA: hypothetical protein VJM75_01625 [Acidimicrobiales bacterium]|nr:hypothetical protein [Acidimicrobiales bacterium]